MATTVTATMSCVESPVMSCMSAVCGMVVMVAVVGRDVESRCVSVVTTRCAFIIGRVLASVADNEGGNTRCD